MMAKGAIANRETLALFMRALYLVVFIYDNSNVYIFMGQFGD
jgi:hypothetical protein